MNGAQTDLLSFLKSVELFQDLTEEDIVKALHYIDEIEITAGSWIFKEGEVGHSICIVKEGRAEVIKEDPAHQFQEQLTIVGPGEYVGEMAYLEKSNRAASFRALEVVKLLIFKLDEMGKNKRLKSLQLHIVNNIAAKISKELRHTNDSLILRLGEKLNLIQSQNEVSDTIVYIFIFQALYLNVIEVFNIYFYEYASLEDIFYPLSILFFALGNISIMLRSPHPLSFYGVNLFNWKRQVWEGALYSTIPLGLLVLIKYLLITYVPAFKSLKLISLVGYASSPAKFFISLLVYTLMVPIQELIARGFLQTCFRNFFQRPHRVFYAILCSNLFYELAHAIRSLWLGIFVFVIGIWWGYLYERHRSIVGVSVSHAILGGAVFFIFDYFSIFTILTS